MKRALATGAGSAGRNTRSVDRKASRKALRNIYGLLRDWVVRRRVIPYTLRNRSRSPYVCDYTPL